MQSFFCITLLALVTTMRADDCCTGVETTSVASAVRPLIIPRNQGANTARELVGLQDFIHLCDVCETYGVLGVEFEYVRSFRPARIARQLFGTGTTSTGAAATCNDGDENFFLRFQGSQVAGRSETSLLADNFGLSQAFDGTLRLQPRIDNFIVDFEFYLGLDCWVPNLWFRTNLPITHTRWDLFDACGNDCNTGTTGIEQINTNSANTPFPACYMDDTTVTPATSIIEALSGNFLFGDMQTEWKFGKFSRKRLDKTRLADIDLILGYDFLCNDCYHIGAFIQATAPTGNAPESVFIFEPIAGNGHHWGLGGGLTAHSTLWENDCDQNLSVWFVGNVQHLFKDTQVRSFDFKTQGPLSRYMLLKEFDSNGAYTGNLINGINFATRTVETSMKVMGDASIKFAYRNCGFVADLGYNVWGRKDEEVRLCSNNTGISSSDTADNKFGFKGCEGVCYLNFNTNGNDPNLITGPANPASAALSNTSSNSTAFKCGTVDNGVNVTGPVADGVVSLTWDSVKANGTAVGPDAGDVAAGVIFAQESRVDGDLSPTLLTTANINFLGARSSLTNKVFGYVGYTWFDCDFTPFVGLHGEVEFDSRRNGDDCTPTDNTTTNRRGDRSINQWGIGIKGGLAF